MLTDYAKEKRHSTAVLMPLDQFTYTSTSPKIFILFVTLKHLAETRHNLN
jgi:hypothetical protein